MLVNITFYNIQTKVVVQNEWQLSVYNPHINAYFNFPLKVICTEGQPHKKLNILKNRKSYQL